MSGADANVIALKRPAEVGAALSGSQAEAAQVARAVLAAANP